MSSNNTSSESGAFLPSLNVFERARLRLNNAFSQKPPERTAGAFLEKFAALKGAAKTQFFRDNREALRSESARNPEPIHESQARARIPARLSAETPLLDKLDSLKGAAKTQFFRDNRAALRFESARTPAPINEPEARTKVPARKPSAETPLLDKLESLKGAAKTKFFRDNRMTLRFESTAS